MYQFGSCVPSINSFYYFLTICQFKTTKKIPHNNYAEQKRRICASMKKNQTLFIKLCLADALIKLMETEEFDSIKVNTICNLADIGRTTFYRHFDNKNSKEELLSFKIEYEWDCYKEKHEEAINQDSGFALTNFIYENKKLFSLLYRNGLISVIMQVFEILIPAGESYDKNASYLMSYFVYGYFGIIYQWIKYDFDEKPEQIRQHLTNTLNAKS